MIAICVSNVNIKSTVTVAEQINGGASQTSWRSTRLTLVSSTCRSSVVTESDEKLMNNAEVPREELNQLEH